MKFEVYRGRGVVAHVSNSQTCYPTTPAPMIHGIGKDRFFTSLVLRNARVRIRAAARGTRSREPYLRSAVEGLLMKVMANKETLLHIMFLGWADEREALFCFLAAKTKKLFTGNKANTRYYARAMQNKPNIVSSASKQGNICCGSEIQSTLSKRTPL